jgi:hypothetical protein
MGIRDKPSGFGSSKKAAKMTRIVRLWVGIGLVMVSSGGRNLTTHRLALHQITTETAILLAPAIPEAGAAAQARRVFFTTTETIDLPSDSVVVSSSPDGSGVLCTDDEARLTILRERQPVAVWSHRFFSADRREILCLSPQRLRLPTGPGQYQVQIELEDRYPPTYSSRPYYLVADSAQPSLAPIPVQGVPASPERLPDEPRESPASGRSGHCATRANNDAHSAAFANGERAAATFAGGTGDSATIAAPYMDCRWDWVGYWSDCRPICCMAAPRSTPIGAAFSTGRSC